MSSKPRIAIVGGGLGGLTAAILLQRSGYDPIVYEQAPQLARLGAGINLFANTTRILIKLGLEKQLKTSGMVLDSWLSREWDTGRVYFSYPMRYWEELYGAPHMILHRGDLQVELAAVLKPGTIQYNKCLAGLDDKNGMIEMTFRDGSKATADIVVGADGVNSVVRDTLLGPEPPTYTGVVAYRGIFPAKLLDRPLDADGTKFWCDHRHWALEDRHFIIYYLTSRRDEVYFVTGSPEPNWGGGLLPVDVEMSEIKACYEGFHHEVQRVIDACPKASKWPFLVRKPLPLWSRGRIVLLGDACHPMRPHMGQGAGMAMEDAVILARCIDAARGDYAGAFELYRFNRIDRASRVQHISNINIWCRYPTDPTWCYGYDAMTVPLRSPSGGIVDVAAYRLTATAA